MSGTAVLVQTDPAIVAAREELRVLALSLIFRDVLDDVAPAGLNITNDVLKALARAAILHIKAPA